MFLFPAQSVKILVQMYAGFPSADIIFHQQQTSLMCSKRSKKTTKIHIFLVKSLQTTFYTHVLKLYINFQSKKTKTFKKITNWQALSLNKPVVF
jgi:hypothetical protein